MGSKEFLDECKEEVRSYTQAHLDKTDNTSVSLDDVFVVWYCKTLQNHKALLCLFDMADLLSSYFFI